MTLTNIHLPPALDSFTPLADHQSHTPANFFGGRPVLHYHDAGVQALISRDEASRLAIFESRSPLSTNGTTNAQPLSHEGPDLAVELVAVFVSSENLILFNSATSKGVSIPYPAISLHAIQRLSSPSDPTQEVQGLYMQLELKCEPSEDYEQPETTGLTLLPPNPTASRVQTLFDAVSNCSNLHPDPASEDNDMEDMENDIMFEGNFSSEGIDGLPGVLRGTNDGGLPPAFSGAGGWITAENAGEYFDEDGNWIGDATGDSKPDLQRGVGRVRARDEEAELDPNGRGRTEEENKRPRVE